MEHFIEALMALVWAKLGSQLLGRPALDSKYRSFKVTNYQFYNKEYYFETYVGQFEPNWINQEFQLVEKTYRHGDIIIYFRWISSYDLEIKYQFSHRLRLFNLRFENNYQEMIIEDEQKAIEGRANAWKPFDLGYLTYYDQVGREMGFQIKPM